MEKIREADSLLHGARYVAAIEKPYRWRDWAAKEEGITGDELIVFIINDEAVRPDGTRVPGLFLISGHSRVVLVVIDMM